MIKKAPAKINLGLHVKQKRDDGFHELETIFYQIPLYDFVELIPSKKDSFHAYNIEIPGDSDQNLCLNAMRLLRSNGFITNHYEIHLLKNIPIGAGLGGGSSDAVAVLKALVKIENVNISNEQLHGLAAELGSDCPLFLMEKATLGTGRGEVLSPIDLDLKGKYLHLVYPEIHISTGAAYGSLNIDETTKSEITIPSDTAEWRESFVNDFEKGLFEKHPELAQIKESLYKSGAFYASMSGSGSSVFGIFDEKPSKEIFTSEGYSEWILEM